MELQSEIYEIGMLMDFYGSLLTDNTLEVLEMYYNNDMSLAEIGEALGISRQGAHSFIIRGRQLLYEYEDKLGMFAKFKQLRARLEEVQQGLEIIDTSRMSEYDAAQLKKLHETLTDIVAKL